MNPDADNEGLAPPNKDATPGASQSLRDTGGATGQCENIAIFLNILPDEL